MTTHRSTPTEVEPTSVKKRRIPGACDPCKRKKIRCDSAEMPGNRCTNCVHFHSECTHKEVSKTLGPAKGYVARLEHRLEKMESLLKKLSPTMDLNQEIESSAEGISTSDSALFRNDDTPLMGTLESLEQLHLHSSQPRFFGKSSGYQLVQTALDIRSEYTGEERVYKANIIQSRRPDFWNTPEWRSSEPPPDFVFPDADLLPFLTDAYFTHINPFLPLLHRPSFEKSVQDGVHLRNSSFGGSLLLVCALGAQYSEDPRVFIEGSNSLHSAGWKWFEQVPVPNKSVSEQPTLHDLQNHALSILFSRSTSIPQGCWIQLGTALRMAQEVGAHRRRPLTAPTAENEHRKRAFWVLLTLDRQISSFSGRQCVLQDGDYDVELPIDCDDEFWDHPDPTLNFKQPSGKPSTMSFFHCYLRLHDILATAMRALYSLRKPNSSVSRAPDPQVIVELDSALNNWMDSVPSHLRWNPKCEHKLFFHQSAMLYVTYYYLQISIHRPFIPSFRNPLSSPFPSLAICTNAARSSCHVFEVQSRTDLPTPLKQPLIFISAIVLLLHIWSSKRSECAPYPRREIEDVQKCMDILKACERRWSSGGRYWDILFELATAGNVLSSPYNERQRDSDAPAQLIYASSLPNPPQAAAGSPRLPTTALDISVQHPQPPNYALPMYSTELGRLPVYGQFNFSESHANSAPASFNVNVDDSATFAPQSPVGADVQNISAAVNHVSIPTFTTTNLPSDSVRDFHSEPLEWNTLTMPQASTENGDTALAFPAQFNLDPMPVMDSDAMTMWSTAPVGFGLNEWGTYIISVNQMTYGQDIENGIEEYE